MSEVTHFFIRNLGQALVLKVSWFFVVFCCCNFEYLKFLKSFS